MSGRAGKHHKKKMSRSQRANLIFPVSRCYRYMKRSIIHKRVSVAAPIYCAAVLEYLCAELMELAGNAARDNSKKRITPRHILLAIANDDELHKLLKGVTISQGGVLPHIPEVLLYKRSQWTKMANARKQGTTLAKDSSSTAKTTPAKKPSTPKKKTPAKKKSTPRKGKSPSKRAKVDSDDEEEEEEEEEDDSMSSSTDMATTVLSEKTLENNGPKLTVVQGDISKVKCDAVIHPTNSSMNLAGLVGRALRTAGGAKLEKDCNQVSSKKSLGVTEAAISGAGNLPSKHVIHVHSPHWSADKGVPELTTTVENALQVAEDNKLKTIAFPSIASGSNDFPKQTAAQTILRTIKHYFRSGVSSSLKQVYFVLYDMESIGVYTTELVRMDTY